MVGESIVPHWLSLTLLKTFEKIVSYFDRIVCYIAHLVWFRRFPKILSRAFLRVTLRLNHHWEMSKCEIQPIMFCYKSDFERISSILVAKSNVFSLLIIHYSLIHSNERQTSLALSKIFMALLLKGWV